MLSRMKVIFALNFCLMLMAYHPPVAQATLWTAKDNDCSSATPLAIYGTPIPDQMSNLTIASLAKGLRVPVEGLCPGVTYHVIVQFNEWRVFTLVTTQGTFSGASGTPCPNRVVSSSSVKSTGLPLILPCSAAESGSVTLTVASVQKDQTSTTHYEQLLLQVPVLQLPACPYQCTSASTTSTTTAASSHSGVQQLPIAGQVTTASLPTLPPRFALPTLSQLLKFPASESLSTKTNTAISGVPHMANLPKIPKVNFTVNSRPFLFPKIKLNLSIPELPTNMKFNLTLPTVDANTLESFPAMLEGVLVQLRTQLQRAATELGVDIVEDSDTTSAAVNASSIHPKQALSSASDAATNNHGIISSVGPWMKAAAAVAHGRHLLEAQLQKGKSVLDGQVDNAYLAADDVVPDMTRSLLTTNGTVKTDVKQIFSRVSLLSSDVFAISYTAFKVAQAAFTLLVGFLKASATGTIDVDNLSLLDFAENAADLGGELSDMLSRMSRLNSNAATPLKLSSSLSDLMERMKNKTST